MDTARQRFARVVGALEDLVAQEAAALQVKDFSGVAEVQERAAPLVSFLAAHGSEISTDPVLAAGIRALQARREETSTRLAFEITLTRDELAQTLTTERRIAQVAPAYGAAAGTKANPRRQLAVVG